MSKDQDVFQGLDELFDYKNQLLEDMLTNKTIVRLLSNDCSTDIPAESLMFEQVFPCEYVPDVTEHGKTFICCEVDIERVSNKTFLSPTIYIWIFTHKSLVRAPQGGLRIDKLCSEIAGILNGSRQYGLGELNLKSARRFSPITNYQGRVLTFTAKDFNRISPTGKYTPSNRKGV